MLKLITIKLCKEQFKVLLFILGVLIAILPTFLGWLNWNQNYSNIGLFVFLYFIGSYVVQFMKDKKLNQRLGGALVAVAFLMLVISAVTISYLQRSIGALANKEMYFYQYWSSFVIAEAIGWYLAVIGGIKIDSVSKISSKLIFMLSTSSLISYELHMHPLFKNRYVEWGVFNYINVGNSTAYFLSTVLTIVVIMFISVIVNIPLSKLSRVIADRLYLHVPKIIKDYIEEQGNC